MTFTHRCSLVITAAAAALASSATLGLGSIARADTPAADITGFTTKNLSVSTQGCKHVPITMHVSSDVDLSQAIVDTTTHIFKGGQEVDYDWFDANKAGSWQWCDFMGGFGTFRLGPTDVDVMFFDDSPEVIDTDYTTGSVTVKQAARAVLPTVTRSGKYVTLQARSTYFRYDSARFVAYNGAHMIFQYRRIGTTAWQRAAAGNADSKGNLTRRILMASKREWRVVIGQRPAIWGAGSSVVAR